MNLNIAICDDSIIDSNYVKELVINWSTNRKCQVNINVFPSAEAFLFHYEENKNYDVLLLDIEMGKMDGVTLARKIRKLNKKNEKEFIKMEILYSDEFDITKEKNNTKNSVIVIGITQDKEYIITSQKKIKDKLTAGFPSGHTKDNEDVIETAKRLLKEKTGYISDDLFIVDEAYSHSGLNNSVTYIVANNCIKTNEEKTNNNYALFKENELEYLINKTSKNNFYELFDNALENISNNPNNTVFSIDTADGERKPLFTRITENVEVSKRNNFAKNISSGESPRWRARLSARVASFTYMLY